MKILLGPTSFAEQDSASLARLREAEFELIANPYRRKLTKEELLELLPDVQGIIAGLEPLDREVLEQSELKVISRVGSGMSNVDRDAADELGIVVCNTPTAPVAAVAELTVGCLLALLRGIPGMNQAMHNKNWSKQVGRQLSEMTIALIGLGNIGRKVGQLLGGFGSRIIGVDPVYSGQMENISILSLEEALKIADVISLHSSGEQQLLGQKEFALMKEGVFLLNAARGGLIDEPSLVDALNSGKVSGAWLDTFSDEPYCGILTGYGQVVLTPHVGSYTLECRRQMEMEATENLINGFARYHQKKSHG